MRAARPCRAMERAKMAEESLETAAEHERILREIESTDTACIGPTLRYRGGAGSPGAGGARRLVEGRVAGVPRPGRGPAEEPVWREGEARLCWAAARFGQQLFSLWWNCPSQRL